MPTPPSSPYLRLSIFLMRFDPNPIIITFPYLLNEILCQAVREEALINFFHSFKSRNYTFLYKTITATETIHTNQGIRKKPRFETAGVQKIVPPGPHWAALGGLAWAQESPNISINRTAVKQHPCLRIKLWSFVPMSCRCQYCTKTVLMFFTNIASSQSSKTCIQLLNLVFRPSELAP